MFKLWGFHDPLVLNSVDVVYCAIIWMENHHSWVAHPHLRGDDHWKLDEQKIQGPEIKQKTFYLDLTTTT